MLCSIFFSSFICIYLSFFFFSYSLSLLSSRFPLLFQAKPPVQTNIAPPFARSFHCSDPLSFSVFFFLSSPLLSPRLLSLHLLSIYTILSFIPDNISQSFHIAKVTTPSALNLTILSPSLIQSTPEFSQDPFLRRE